MAILAGEVAVIRLLLVRGELKAGRVVIESRRAPSRRSMTRVAACPKISIMRIIFDMTGGAVHGRTLEDIVLVTVGAGCAGMLAIELERELGMVDAGRFPAAWGVTGSTFSSQLTVVRIIRAVTGNTAGGGILEIVVLVTVGA